MLYSEFLKGTRAPETPDTYDQFQIIGQIYEDCFWWNTGYEQYFSRS